MGNVIAAKQLRDALTKAQGVGIVEEEFNLGDLPLTVQSLRPDQHEAILADCEGLDDLVYLHTYQRAHVARALVEVGGLDLRGVEYVEDEVTDDKGKVRKARVERHAWLTLNVLSTWGREAIYTAFRKVNDAIEKAERVAKEGITFLTPEETDEEKVRRLLGEAKDVIDTLPALLRRRVLEDHGLIEQSTAAEIKAAQEKLDQVKRAEEGLADNPMDEAPPAADPEPTAEDLDVLRQGVRQAQAVSPPPAAPPARQPLNRTVDIGEVGTRIAPNQPGAPSGPMSARAAEAAAHAADLERELGLPTVATAAGSPGAPPVPEGVERSAPVELRGRPVVDPVQQAKDAASIIDQPPPAGINARWRPGIRR